MSTLHIGNQATEHMVGDLTAFPPGARRAGGNTGTRLLWMAEPGDVFVLAQPPTPEFWSYATELLGLASNAVSVLVPPAGSAGTDILTHDRITQPDFVSCLRRMVASGKINRIQPFNFDSTVGWLARDIGLTNSTTDFAFLTQGGADLLNSKCTFRAIAAGVGAPIAPGTVADLPEKVLRIAGPLIDGGQAVMIKRDFHVGGYGNTILYGGQTVQAIGANVCEGFRNRADLTEYVVAHWNEYTDHGRHQVVVEEYLPDSVPIFAELDIGDHHTRLLNRGEMRMRPVFDGFNIPARTTSEDHFKIFLDGVSAICDAVSCMGYRGLINIDGIVTPDGRVFITEFNGRLGGTTHLHVMAERLLGPDYATTRTLTTRNRWKVPSFHAALARLVDLGVAYDASSRSGVILTCDNTEPSQTAEYCIVADSYDSADVIEEKLLDPFPET